MVNVETFAKKAKGIKVLGASVMLGCIVLFGSCKKGSKSSDPVKEEIGVIKSDLFFYGLTTTGKLNKYNAKDPSMLISTATLSGLQPNEKLLSIDFRPATGQLYGLGSSSRIYILNVETGAARAIGAGPFTPALDGDVAGFDFNPTADRIRVVTSKGQNLRLNPETGMIAATDGLINGVTDAMISSVAYTNNMAGALTTVLYDIDAKTKKLYTQDAPNDGKLLEVGSLESEFSAEAGFDISPEGIALAALQNNNQSALYQIDLKTGKAYKLGDLMNEMLTGIAIPTNPVAYAVCTVNCLYIFNPTKVEREVRPITGLRANDQIIGLDMRPVNGQLYALSSSSRLYTLNASSGVATLVSTEPFSTRLEGTEFGFDFNPTSDRIRIVSNTGQNLRVNPQTAYVTFVDRRLNPGTPEVTAAAYTNSFAGAATTQLYVFDTTSDKLFSQTPPNDGTLVEIGSLGVDASNFNGFDISGTTGKGYAIFTINGAHKLYDINLSTGKATVLSDFPIDVRGLTIGLGF